MTDELQPVEGISRRDLLKRSAIVGGASAMVWAAPSITTLGGRAFGAEGTKIEGFSYAAAVVQCGGVGGPSFRVKYQRDEGGFEKQPEALPGCTGTTFATGLWAGAQKVDPLVPDVNPGQWKIGETEFSITVSQRGTDLKFTLDPESDCVFAGSAAEGGVTKEGNLDCNTNVDGGGTKVLTFDLSFFD